MICVSMMDILMGRSFFDDLAWFKHGVLLLIYVVFSAKNDVRMRITVIGSLCYSMLFSDLCCCPLGSPMDK